MVVPLVTLRLFLSRGQFYETLGPAQDTAEQLVRRKYPHCRLKLATRKRRYLSLNRLLRSISDPAQVSHKNRPQMDNVFHMSTTISIQIISVYPSSDCFRLSTHLQNYVARSCRFCVRNHRT